MWPRSLDLRGLSSAECLDLAIGVVIAICALPAFFLRRKHFFSPRKIERWLEVVILLVLCPLIRSRLVTYFASRQFYLRGRWRLLGYIALGIFLRETVEIHPEQAVRICEAVAFSGMYLVGKKEERKRITIFLKASLGWPLSFSAVSGPWTFLVLIVLQMGMSAGFYPVAESDVKKTPPRQLLLPPPSPRRGLRPCLCPRSPLQDMARGLQTSLPVLSPHTTSVGAHVSSPVDTGVVWMLSAVEPMITFRPLWDISLALLSVPWGWLWSWWPL